MPFRSASQVRKFAELVKSGQMSQAEFDKWQAETPDLGRLPDRVPQPLPGRPRKKRRL